MASHTVYREVQFAHKNAEVSYIVNDDEESNGTPSHTHATHSHDSLHLLPSIRCSRWQDPSPSTCRCCWC